MLEIIEKQTKEIEQEQINAAIKVAISKANLKELNKIEKLINLKKKELTNK